MLTNTERQKLTKPQKLAILISGRGSNMLALAEACAAGQINATVNIVISNRADATGLNTAQALGIRTAVVEHKQFEHRQDFDDALQQVLNKANPDWIVLAGFMRILGEQLIQHWQGRMLNIHPSLLPKYPGLNTHARALEAGDSEAGASAHIVTTELDAGPVVAQVRVPVLEHDTPETLAARVLKKEHGLLVAAVKQCLINEHH